MATSIGQINLDLGVNTSGFRSQLNGATKTAKSAVGGMSSAFGKLGKIIAVAFSVKQIASFAKECLKLGSDLAEVQNVVDVTFGSMSSRVNEFAKDAMTSFGLSEAVAKKYMGQFGAMSKAFGNTEAMAYDQAAALTGLAGDVASFYNMTTDEAFTKLKAVYTGETESLKELGVVMTQAALDSYALQKGLGKTTSQMSEQEKVALRLSFVQDRLADASGDFARTSDGWANQTRVLSLRFDALKASIGQGLIAALTPVIRLLNQLMVYLQAAADAFSNFMQAIFGRIGGSSDLTSAGAALAAGAEVASASSGDLASNSASAAKSAAKIKKSLAGFDEINILGSGSAGAGGGGASGGASSAGTSPMAGGVSEDAITKAEKALNKLTAKLKKFAKISGLSDMWDDFLAGIDNAKAGVQNIFTALSNAITVNMPALESLKINLVNAFLAISQTITGIWGDMWLSLAENFRLWTEENQLALQTFFGNVITMFTNTGILISTIVGQAFTDLENWWTEHGQPVFDGFVKAIGDVWTWILRIYNEIIDPIIQKIIGLLNSLWQSTLRPLWNNVLLLLSDIGEMLLAFWNNILKPVVDWIITNFGPPIKKVFDSILWTVNSVVKTVGDLLGHFINILRGVMQFLTGVFTGDWKKAWQGVQKIFKGVWDALVGIIKAPLNIIIGAINTLLGGITGAVNLAIKALNALSFTVPDWVPVIGGQTWGFNLPLLSAPKIPYLANGAYVAANTPQLAVIGDNKHEGEIVAPESKIAEAVARGFAMVLAKLQGVGGSQNDRPIYLTLKLGEDTFWEGFVDYHNSIVKRTGDSPLLI